MSTEPYQLFISRGTLINDDPLKRCYNGCYFNSHIEWSNWEPWLKYPTKESAEQAAKLFSRDTQKFKVVKNT